MQHTLYILMFLSALKLKRPLKEKGIFQIPKGLRLPACFLGLFGCMLTMVLSFFPPEEIEFSTTTYMGLIALGNGIFLLPAFLLPKRVSAK